MIFQNIKIIIIKTFYNHNFDKIQLIVLKNIFEVIKTKSSQG